VKKQFAIGTQLLTCISALIVLLAALAGSALYSIGSIKTGLLACVVTGKNVQTTGEMATQLQMLRANARGMMMYSAINDIPRVTAEVDLLYQRASALERLFADTKPLLASGRGIQLIEIMQQELASLMQAEQEMKGLCEAGKTAEAMAAMRDHAVSHTEAIGNALAELKDRQQKRMEQAASDGSALASVARILTWSLALLSLLTAVIVTRVVMALIKRLRAATEGLDEGIAQITETAAQLATSSQTLAQGAADQAASLEETSASTEEITSMTRSNAQSSQSAATVMTTVHHKVTEGNHALGEMMTSMQEINTSSSKIAKIIKVIDEIAFQTNILALNAAVEAARAGEAGMGFAVVADEVRNLAQRSAEASRETAALIEESIASSRLGKERLENVSGVIRAITASAEEVKTLVDAVNGGSQEQARGIEQIAKAVAQMDQTTQSTAATAEESASAAAVLSAHARTMTDAVRQLRILVDGTVELGPDVVQ
jgi:methyl-accepting chemotaxis protein